MNGYYKVPLRQVYCESLFDCVVHTVYCLVWLKVTSPFRAKFTDIG